MSVELSNVGDRPASDVAQLYVAAPTAAGEPPRQLRGFTKVRLASGDSATVTFEVGVDDLAAFDDSSGNGSSTTAGMRFSSEGLPATLWPAAWIQIHSGRAGLHRLKRSSQG